MFPHTIHPNMAENQVPKDFHDPREQDVQEHPATTTTGIPAVSRTLRDVGAVLTFHLPDPPLDVPKAKAKAQAEREQAIHDLLPEAEKERLRQALRDTHTAMDIADVILAAEAEERHSQPLTFGQVEPKSVRQSLLHDATVSLRIRRPVWRRVASAKVQERLYLVVKDQLSHLFAAHYGPEKADEAMRAFAAHAAGPAYVAATETLSGRLTVTAREFAHAIIRCGE